ncbi:MAG: hypothetical protein JWO82_2894 [Akkermansiaceae bacterium]|nr:hypothetical protein [Akkermansiaceae bacterium]
MKAYSELIHGVWDSGRSVAENPPPALPSELELQALWFAGAFVRDFSDTEGRPVHIVQFGEWNRTAGPDFLRTAVSIDGETHEGALELDLRPSDWEAHGHGSDPAFAQTVLHVVFVDPGVKSFTRTCEHRQVPCVIVPAFRVEEALQYPRRLTAIARPGRCVRPLAGMPEEDVRHLLEEAAEHRSATKAARLMRTADAHGKDSALWQAVAETLGYPANALAMKLLAQRVSLQALKEAPGSTEALLFGAAGFLAPDLHEKAPPNTQEHLRTLWDTWWKLRGHRESAHSLPWKSGGQRPANHPHRRVAALAALARDWPKFRRLALARPFSARTLIDYLSELSDPFWTHRYTLSSAVSAQPVALFGKAQATELLANHLFPWAIHDGEKSPPYFQLAAGARNEKVRRCAIRLFGSEEDAAPWLKKAAHHQALLQIYRDFCLEDATDCADCPFPEQLAQWRAQHNPPT